MNDIVTIVSILGGVVAIAVVTMSVARRWVRTEDRAASIKDVTQDLTSRVISLEEWRAKREALAQYDEKTLNEIKEDLHEVRDKVVALWTASKRLGKRPEDS